MRVPACNWPVCAEHVPADGVGHGAPLGVLASQGVHMGPHRHILHQGNILTKLFFKHFILKVIQTTFIWNTLVLNGLLYSIRQDTKCREYIFVGKSWLVIYSWATKSSFYCTLAISQIVLLYCSNQIFRWQMPKQWLFSWKYNGLYLLGKLHFWTLYLAWTFLMNKPDESAAKKTQNENKWTEYKKKKQNCRSELYVLQISENWLPRDYWAWGYCFI